MNKIENWSQITIFTKEDFSDDRIVSFMRKNEQFSFNEYSNFINSISIESEISKSIINFIITYKGGGLIPDKCNAYEPINEPFHSLRITEAIKWISQPGGAFYFKRNKTKCKYIGCIENKRFAPIWTDRKLTKLLIPEVPQASILGELKFWFDKKDLIKNNSNTSLIDQLITDLDRVVQVDSYLIKE